MTDKLLLIPNTPFLMLCPNSGVTGPCVGQRGWVGRDQGTDRDQEATVMGWLNLELVTARKVKSKEKSFN